MFGKKTTAEDVMKMFSALPDEEKKKFLDGVKPTTEEQIDKAKADIAEKGPDSQTEKDRIDESVGEQEHEDGNEDNQTAKDRVDESEGMQEAEEKHEAEDSMEEEAAEHSDKTEENREDVMQRLSDRVTALEEGIKALNELKAQMEEYSAKQADSFGYKGKAAEEKKSMQDMSADELKKHILSGN